MAAVAVLAFGCEKQKHATPAEHAAMTANAPGDTIGRGPWRWIGTVTPTAHTVCKNPDVYKISFLPDSTTRLLIDCNRGSGPYHISGHALRIGQFAMTRMLCPPGSMDTTFAGQISRVNAWHHDADTLQLDAVGAFQMKLVR
jgi:heat shock protein HslJ